MAKQQSNSGIPSVPNRFDKGLGSDIHGVHLDTASWTHARNAINNAHIGEPHGIGNEPSNQFCSSAPYDIIGVIHIQRTRWWVFSTDDSNGHEIGIFDESNCSYTRVVNDSCLNFSKAYPITGTSRPTFDCGDQAYWADNNNPDRTIREHAVPWVQECVDDNGEEEGGCITCVDTDVLDCDKLRLEVLMGIPCARVSRGPAGGSVLNGSYYVQIAYVVNGSVVSDYFGMSNVVHIFEHDEANASLDIEVDGLDTDNFDEYQVVIVQNIAQKTSVKILGVYSTNQDKITVDLIAADLVAIDDSSLLIVSNPIYDKSEGIFSVGKYAYRVAPTGKLDFNYQPLANQIGTKWQAVEYPKEYYKNGGSNIGHMRDEVYAYFIRWRYTTGDVSNSYHIPGRAPRLYEIPTAPPGPAIQMMEDADYLTVESNNIEQQQGLVSKVFEMFNTASGTAVSIILDDGGEVVAEGDMAYWESDEFYPDNKPEVWNVGDPSNPQWDLCGKRIRHHKFPENTLYAGIGSNAITNHYTATDKIRVMAVAFDNVQPPVDNNGVLIPNIAGYEILRGSRTGNKTVVYKGMINNMRQYQIAPELATGRQGLYPNYPFNSLFPDLFNSLLETTYEPQTGNTSTATNPNRYQNYFPNPNFSRRNFTFHSPDTMFNKPFLGQKELKIYGAMFGEAEGQYLEVAGHPKHVFVTDLVFYVGLIAGVGLAIAKQVGKVEKKYPAPTFYQYPQITGGGNTAIYAYSQNSSINNTTTSASVQMPAIDAIITGSETSRYSALDFADGLTGLNTGETTQDSLMDNIHSANQKGSGITTSGMEITYKDKSSVPPLLSAIQGIPTFITNVTEGADLIIDIITKASNTRQFAQQYQAYCGYESFAVPYLNNRRRIIDEAVYLRGHLQEFKTTHRVNNLLRSKTVMFDTTVDVADIVGAIADDTMDRIRLSDLGAGGDAYKKPFRRRASSHYVAYKTRLRSQYGKVHSVKQVPASNCVIPIGDGTSGTIFGGDTYIGRYQEKNTFYHFYKWLLGEPDRTEFNYHLYDALQHTAFWADTDPFDVTEFINSIPSALQSALTSGSGALTTFFQNLVTPSDKGSFDKLYDYGSVNSGIFTQKNAFFYLFHSSVRDFYVESEINIDMRDWEDDVEKMHWDVIQNLREMFAPPRIKAGNYYKIDRGLSVNNMPFSKLSWSKLQDLQYDPTLAETCYKYFPNRLQYSLPQTTSLKKDNWSAFLANNYKDFTSKVSTIKAFRQTGIMILFENHAPGLLPGVDELFLKSGTSITIGDGNLFARDEQRLSNADRELEYGSCQSRRSALNTPYGIFYMNVDQGKIFFAGEGLKEVILRNKYWLNQYLPFQILKDFPEYDQLDNPVGGVACQSVYDNEWGIVYFMKRDFRLKPEWVGRVEYLGEGIFLYDGITRGYIGNPLYWDNASWTLSYDPKNGQEISFHDWHPNLVMSGKNTFLTVKNDGVWRHNSRCDSYCNFYGADYPFEIEFQVETLPHVTTLRNIEYYMEAMQYAENCRDRFHVLDFNFDQAIVHNSEQVSGLLRLNLEPKNNVSLLYQYPIVGLNQIDILYSKEEQKYRINQFWDITNDRGEYSPLAMETIWVTEPNGYIRNLNPMNLNYNKEQMERKKFRHNQNRILLRRTVSGNKKMLLLMANTKVQNSPR